MDNSWKKPSSFLPWKQISLAKIDFGCCTLPTGLRRQLKKKYIYIIQDVILNHLSILGVIYPCTLLLCARSTFGLEEHQEHHRLSLWEQSGMLHCQAELGLGMASMAARVAVKGRPNPCMCPGWQSPAQDWLPAVGSRRANGNSPPCGSD